MRSALLTLTLALTAGCGSSSAGVVTDAGVEEHHHDAGHPKPRDAGRDAPSVCAPLAPKDAGVDAAPDAAEAGKDAAPVDAHADAPGDAAKEAAVADAGCVGNCAIANPDAYAKFIEYQLTECGCTATGPCYSACHDATSFAPGSACGTCLATQGAEGLSSTCTLAAAADCSMDATCSPFQSCAGMCPM